MKKALLLALLLNATASLHGYANSLADAAALSKQPNCCADFKQYQFASMKNDQQLMIVSPDSAKFKFDGELSNFIGVELNTEKQQRLEIRSYLMKHGILVPNLIFLSSDMQVLSAMTDVSLWNATQDAQGRSAISVTLTPPSGSKYLIAYGTKNNADTWVDLKSSGAIQMINQNVCRVSSENGLSCNNVTNAKQTSAKQITASGSVYGNIRISYIAGD